MNFYHTLYYCFIIILFSFNVNIIFLQLSYIPIQLSEEIPKQLPCTIDHLLILQQNAAFISSKHLKEEWRDRVMAATLDAFESFPEIDKFAIESIEQFEDSKLNRIVRQLEIRMVEQMRGLIQRSVAKWLHSVQTTTTPLVYTTLHVPTHHETMAFIHQQKEEEQRIEQNNNENDGGEEDGEDDGEKATTVEENKMPLIYPTFQPSLNELTESICNVMTSIGTTALTLESFICPDLLAMLSIDEALPMIHSSVVLEAVHAVIEQGKEQLVSIMEEQLTQPKLLVEKFVQYTSVMALDPTTYWKEWDSNNGKTKKGTFKMLQV